MFTRGRPGGESDYYHCYIIIISVSALATPTGWPEASACSLGRGTLSRSMFLCMTPLSGEKKTPMTLCVKTWLSTLGRPSRLNGTGCQGQGLLIKGTKKGGELATVKLGRKKAMK